MTSLEPRWDDPNWVKRILRQKGNGPLYKHVCASLRDDPSFNKSLVKHVPSLYQYMSEKIRSNEAITKQVLSGGPTKSGRMYQFASKDLQNDPEIALLAVKADYKMFSALPQTLQHDEAFVAKAMGSSARRLLWPKVDVGTKSSMSVSSVIRVLNPGKEYCFDHPVNKAIYENIVAVIDNPCPSNTFDKETNLLIKIFHSDPKLVEDYSKITKKFHDVEFLQKLTVCVPQIWMHMHSYTGSYNSGFDDRVKNPLWITNQLFTTAKGLFSFLNGIFKNNNNNAFEFLYYIIGNSGRLGRRYLQNANLKWFVELITSSVVFMNANVHTLHRPICKDLPIRYDEWHRVNVMEEAWNCVETKAIFHLLKRVCRYTAYNTLYSVAYTTERLKDKIQEAKQAVKKIELELDEAEKDPDELFPLKKVYETEIADMEEKLEKARRKGGAANIGRCVVVDNGYERRVIVDSEIDEIDVEWIVALLIGRSV